MSLPASLPRELPPLDSIDAAIAYKRGLLASTSHDPSLEASKERCKTLVGFIREAWHVLEPNQVYVHGWHIDAICQHLEAITFERGVQHFLANVPPGPMRDDSLVETARGPLLLRDVKVGDLVLTHKGRYRPVSAVHDQGVLPILKIVTNSGRITHAAPSHPYLTPSGWVDAADLNVGDVLAVVNRAEDRPGAVPMIEEEARLLGYLVGDGCLTQQSTMFVNADREVIDDFRRCAAALGFATSERRKTSHWIVSILGGAAVHRWLDSHGLRGKSSYTKRIPPKVMTSDRATLGAFIGAYWTCDGGFDVRPSRKRGSTYRAYGTTVSEGLAGDLLQALGSLGIESRLRRKSRPLETVAQPGGRYVSYSVEVQNEAMVARFAALPSLCSTKRSLAQQCRKSFDRPLWDDVIVSIEPDADARCMCLTVEEDHSFVCSGIAVKNSMKSLIVAVFWPAFEWGPASKPYLSYLSGSYEQSLAIRDNRRMKRLVESEWYQSRWPMRITGGDERFENDKGGWRWARAFTSMTGGRANRVIIDDPHSVTTAESDQDRQTTIRTFREAIPDRLNSQSRDSIIVIMQRLHTGDVSGVIEELGLDYTRLIIPMEFEADRRCETRIGWVDPRTVEGELMCEERWSIKDVEDLKRAKGSYAYAGQYQQRPAAREGGLFKRAWWKMVDRAPLGTRWVRAWDIAATEEIVTSTAAWTVGVLMGRQPDGRFIIGDVVRKRVEGFGLRKLIKDTAKADGKLVEIDLPQDPGATGKIVAKDLILMLAGHVVHASPESRHTDGKLQRANKLQRAEPVAVQVEAGNVDVIKAPWNEEFFAETDVFPASKFKDQVDAMSRGFAKLIGGSLFTTPEIIFTEDLGQIPETFARFAALAIDKAYVTGVWFAIDRQNDVFHVYDTHVAMRGSLALLADAIWRRNGKWMPLLIDPTDDGRSEEDGLEISERLASFQLNVSTASIDYDAGVEVMSQKLETGRLRVGSQNVNWLGEYRRFGRDDKGEPQFTGNNLMRATMLGLIHGAEVAMSEAKANSDAQGYDRDEARAMFDGGSTGY